MPCWALCAFLQLDSGCTRIGRFRGCFLCGVIGGNGAVIIGWVFVMGLLMADLTRSVWLELRGCARGQVGSVRRAVGRNNHWRLFRRPRFHPAA